MNVKKQVTASLLYRIIHDIHTFSKLYLPVKIVQILVNAIYPYIIILLPKYIIDNIMQGENKNAFFVIIVFLAINIVYGIVKHILGCYFSIKDHAFRKIIDKNLIDKVMMLDYKLVELSSIHTMKEEAKNGSKNIYTFINNVQIIITSIVTFCFATYLISYLNVLIVALIFAIVVFNGFMNYRKNKSDLKMWKRFSVLTRKWIYLNYVCRDTANAKEIRFYHLSSWLAKKIEFFAEDNEKILKTTFHEQAVVKQYVASSEMVQNGFVYVYVGLQLWRKLITVGEFTQYIGAIHLISSNMIAIINSILDIKKDKQFIYKYYNFLDLASDNTKKDYQQLHINDQAQYNIEIKNVWFRYNENAEYVLKGLNLTLIANQKLSVVGRNGCGKTTLIKLLLRLYQPNSGQILLNGKDIYTYELSEYLKLFSVIFQDFKIFSFTIRDNILMADMPLDPNDLELSEDIRLRMEMAIEKANLDPITEKYPDGLQTYINKNYMLNGYDLSGGNQQSLALSRAYYRNTNHIILDEPTAMLDPVNECRIYENFNALIGNKTAVYISHRMASSRFCDAIAYIEDGVVKEYGTHDELMMLGDKYAVLFNTQAELFSETDKTVGGSVRKN